MTKSLEQGQMPALENATQQALNNTTQPAQSLETATVKQPDSPRPPGLDRQYSKMLDALNSFRS